MLLSGDLFRSQVSHDTPLFYNSYAQLTHADLAPIPDFAFVGDINLKNKFPCVGEQLSQGEGFSIEDQAAM